MKDFEEMERRLARSGKTEQIRSIAESKDGENLMKKIDPEKVERAVQSGDSEALRSVLMDVLRTGEGRRIAKQLEETMRES